jgi:hypothetical protein
VPQGISREVYCPSALPKHSVRGVVPCWGPSSVRRRRTSFGRHTGRGNYGARGGAGSGLQWTRVTCWLPLSDRSSTGLTIMYRPPFSLGEGMCGLGRLCGCEARKCRQVSGNTRLGAPCDCGGLHWRDASFNGRCRPLRGGTRSFRASSVHSLLGKARCRHLSNVQSLPAVCETRDSIWTLVLSS